MTFKDRKQAGALLAENLSRLSIENPIVFAIPRGGVIVAAEVARAFGARLSLVIPRKIGAPLNPELAIGAVTPDGDTIINEQMVRSLGVEREYIEAESKKEARESQRRRQAYGVEEPGDLQNSTAILIDDGIATGYTVLATARYLRKKRPERLILAVPVAPPDTIEWLSKEVDDVVVLYTPHWFAAVGQFYEDFPQVSDEEVITTLKYFQEMQNEGAE